jgi:hypothetical protein
MLQLSGPWSMPSLLLLLFALGVWWLRRRVDTHRTPHSATSPGPASAPSSESSSLPLAVTDPSLCLHPRPEECPHHRPLVRGSRIVLP